VVINYWTGVSGQCTTWLAPAGVTFWARAPAVQWVVTRASNGNAPDRGIEFGPADSVRRHRAVFRNLPHDTLYHYRTACLDWFPAVDSYFRTPPGIDSTRDVQFAVWSDIIKAQHIYHYYPSGLPMLEPFAPCPRWKYGATAESFVEEALENAARQGLVDFGLIAGDLSDYDVQESWGEDAGGSVAGYLYRYFSMYEPLLAGIPVFTQHGNHDVYSIYFANNRDEDYFWMLDGPRGAHTDAGFGRQWFSFDWGDSHVMGLDVVKQESVDDEEWDEVLAAELSDWRDGSPFNLWLEEDIAANDASTQTRWRLAFQHGAPTVWSGPNHVGRCGERHLHGYCDRMNDFGLDFLFLGHHDPDRLMHVGGGVMVPDHESVLYSFQTKMGGGRLDALDRVGNREGFLHVRVRRDAMVVSRVWPGPYRDTQTSVEDLFGDTWGNTAPQYDSEKRPPFLRHPAPNDTPAIGALIECFKVVPSIRDDYLATLGCEHDACLQNLGCTRHEGLQTSSGDSVVWQCDRSVIPEGYLKRQIVEIVTRAEGSDYGKCNSDVPSTCAVVVAENLLDECTPCAFETYPDLKRLDQYTPPGVRVITGLTNNCGRVVWQEAGGSP
jgi:hypothetical protein